MEIKNIREDKRSLFLSIATHGGITKTTEQKGLIEVLRQNDFNPALLDADLESDGFRESYGSRDENGVLLPMGYTELRDENDELLSIEPSGNGVTELNLEDKDSTLSNIMTSQALHNRDIVLNTKGGSLNHFIAQYGSLRPFYDAHKETTAFYLINPIVDIEKSFLNLDALADAHQVLQTQREKRNGGGLEVEIHFVNILNLGKVGESMAERKKITEKYNLWLKTVKLPAQIKIHTFRFEARFDNPITKDFFTNKSILDNIADMPMGTKIIATQFLNEREEAWGELLGF